MWRTPVCTDQGLPCVRGGGTAEPCRRGCNATVCNVLPRSGAVRAALEKSSVAVTTLRFYWAARSREGAGSMERDEPEERGGLGDAFSWDARRGASGTGGAQPPAYFGNFSAVKSSPPEAGEKPPTCMCGPSCWGPLTHLFGCAAREWVQFAFACRFRAPVPGG